MDLSEFLLMGVSGFLKLVSRHAFHFFTECRVRTEVLLKKQKLSLLI